MDHESYIRKRWRPLMNLRSRCPVPYLLLVVVVVVVGLGLPSRLESAIENPQSAIKRPVILDTDICDDIDDTWALAVLLQSPELDCRLVTPAVGARGDTIMNSPDQITLIAVGPLPNVAEALKREPRIAEKADFIGMHGSIYRGYGSEKPDAEYNVKQDVEAARRVFTA